MLPLVQVTRFHRGSSAWRAHTSSRVRAAASAASGGSVVLMVSFSGSASLRSVLCGRLPGPVLRGRRGSAGGGRLVAQRAQPVQRRAAAPAEVVVQFGVDPVEPVVGGGVLRDG